MKTINKSLAAIEVAANNPNELVISLPYSEGEQFLKSDNGTWFDYENDSQTAMLEDEKICIYDAFVSDNGEFVNLLCSKVVIRFTLHPSQEQGFWVATDQYNGIVVKFQEHNFNGNNEVTLLNGDKFPTVEAAIKSATYLREIGDWLSKEHYNIAMPSLINDRQRIGQQIRDYRLAAGLSQTDLAQRAGITTANVCNIEAGKYSVGLDVLNRIANALNRVLDLTSRP